MYLRRYASATLTIGAVLAGLLGTVSAARAELTQAKCFANKVKAWGKLRDCQRGDEAKALLGNKVDAAKCARTFDDAIAKIDAKATKLGLGCRFLDRGDGTVTDVQTGLMWAKLSGLDGVPSSNVLDADNLYSWTTAQAAASTLGGTSVDGGPPIPLLGFPLYGDWRLPTITELRSVVDCDFGGPCFRTELGATRPGVHYWSSSLDATDASLVWRVFSTGGIVGVTSKSGTEAMRPVRSAF